MFQMFIILDMTPHNKIFIFFDLVPTSERHISVIDSHARGIGIGRMLFSYGNTCQPFDRVLQLRSRLGVRIELCYLFVKISLGKEVHQWATADELYHQIAQLERELSIARTVVQGVG